MCCAAATIPVLGAINRVWNDRIDNVVSQSTARRRIHIVGLFTIELPKRNDSSVRTTEVLESGGVETLHSVTQRLTDPELSFPMN